jgi:predicted ATP-grasp superfamily ATP-dependent carboligase
LNFDQSIYKPLGKIILKWTIENECKLLISASGTPLQQIEEKDKKIWDPPVYAAGSTKKASRRLQDAGIQQLSNGSILGIPALLLN